MKKYILLALGSAVFLACSPRKDGYLNRKYQGFTTFYNVLFNGEEALNAELKQRDKSYRDNFHAPYIKLLTYEEQISSAQMENLGVSDNENGLPFGGSDNNAVLNPTRLSTLEIAEMKAQKAIDKHSMMFKGEEKNKTIFDAYLVLAKARLFQNKPLEALDALNTVQKIYKKDKSWNINPFDQWGVEKGKEIANQLLPILNGQQQDLSALDASTQGLLKILLGKIDG